MVFVSARDKSRRAFQGGKLSPATKPRFVSPGLRTTRPEATRLHRHMIMPVSLYMRSKASSSAGVGRPAPVSALALPLAPGAGRGCGLYHLAIGAHIGNYDIHARQRLHLADIEVRVHRVLLNRRVVVDNLPVSIRVSEGTKIARLKGFDSIGCILGHVPTVEDRIVHHQQTAPAATTRI